MDTLSESKLVKIMSIRTVSILLLWLNFVVVSSAAELIPLLKTWDDKSLMAENEVRERIAALRSIAANGKTLEERLTAQVFLGADLAELSEVATEKEQAESLELLNKVTEEAPGTWQAEMAQGLRLYVLLKGSEFQQALELGQSIKGHWSLEEFRNKGDQYFEAALDGGAIQLPETQEAFADQIQYAIVLAQIQLRRFHEADEALSEISNEQERRVLASQLVEAKKASEVNSTSP